MKHDWLENYEDLDLKPMEIEAEEQARILADALKKAERMKAEPKREKTSPKKAIRWFCMLAAVLAIGVLTAGAAVELLDAREMLHWIFGAESSLEQIEALNIPGYPIGLSQERDGYTLELHGVVGDSHCCYIVFDVIAPEGTVLDSPYGYGFLDTQFWPEENPDGFGYYSEELPDDDPGDNTIRFMFAYSQSADMAQNRYTLRLEGFTEYVDDGSGYHELVLTDAVWEFTFPIDFEALDTFVSVPVRKTILSKDGNAKLKTVEVSTVSILLEYRQNFQEEILKEILLDQAVPLTENITPEIRLQFADGSTLLVDEVHCKTGQTSSRMGKTGFRNTQILYNFESPVNTSDLVSVEIDGVLLNVGS